MSFWDQHGVLFLLAMLLFPRLTLFFWTGIPFSVLTWIGWIFIPRFVAAYYGTWMYWDTDPVLCVLAWIAAFSMAGGGGKTIQRKRQAKV